MAVVTDPDVLRLLNGGGTAKPVTDPAVLQRLSQPTDPGLQPPGPDADGMGVSSSRSERQGNFGDQLLSGAVEGVAGTLELPTTLMELFYNNITRPVRNLVTGGDEQPADWHGFGDWYLDDQTSRGHVKDPSDSWMVRDARKVAQYATGSLIPGTPLKPMITGGVGAGVGAVTANHIAPDNPYAEMAGAILGGGVGAGSVTASQRARATRSAPPIQYLRDQASTLYQKAEARGVVASPTDSLLLADDMYKLGQKEGAISPTGRVNDTFPDVVEAIRSFSDYAKAGVPISVKDLQVLRSKLTEAAKSTKATEQRLAMQMLRKLDNFVEPLAPELKEANALYRRAMVGDLIETQMELAASDAGQFSGSGYENALRRRFRELDRHIIREDGVAAGLSMAEIAAIRKVANGGPVENVLRYVGKLAPTGVVSMGLGGGIPAGLASVFGASPITAGAVGLGTMGIGGLARAGATNITKKNAEAAASLARRGGPATGVPNANAAVIAALLASGNTAEQERQRIIEDNRNRMAVQ